MTKRPAVRLIFTMFLLCLALPALAQKKEVSETDKAVFSFFKLSGGNPAYETWVMNSEPYQTSFADPILQSQIYEVELLRLKYGFGTYDVKEEFIKIRTPVKLMLHDQIEGQTTMSFMFPKAGQGNVPYFPFPYGKEWIALIVNDLQEFLNLPMPEEQAKQAAETLTLNKIYEGEIVLHVRATEADDREPLKLDGTEQWLLMGETGHFELLADGKKLAEYTAPWYYSRAENDLLNLIEQ
jgi:hypothetical protein